MYISGVLMFGQLNICIFGYSVSMLLYMSSYHNSLVKFQFRRQKNILTKKNPVIMEGDLFV